MDNDRQEYTRALYWLLANDLLIQAHEYVRVVARAEIKAKAKQQLIADTNIRQRERFAEAEAKRRASHGNSSGGETPLSTLSTLPSENSTVAFPTAPPSSDRLNQCAGTNLSPADEAGANKDGPGFLKDPQAAIIDKPGKPSPAESRCLRIIRDQKDEKWQKYFTMWVFECPPGVFTTLWLKEIWTF